LLCCAMLGAERLPAQVSEQSGQKVADVVVEGNDRVARRRVLSAAQLNVGDDYTVFAIGRAMNNLWKTELYKDIDILAEDVADGGIKLIIRVQEAPIVSKLTIDGNQKLKDSDVKPELDLRIGGLFSPSKLQQSTNKIIELYREKGFYNSKVQVETDTMKAKGRVEIALQIDEGSKIKIRNIEFEGNDFFPVEMLRGALSTKTKSLIKFWRTGSYDEEKFQKDMTEKLPEFYSRNGFLNMQVLGHEMEFMENGKDVTIRISVDEGQQYYVGALTVTGNAHFPDDVILTAFQLVPGSVFNQEKFEESMDKVREIYGDEGYIYMQPQPMQEYEDSLINLTLMIREGEPATVRKILIQGNESTFENVIRRRIRLYPGDLFRQPLVKMSYQSLVNSGFFEPDIGIEPRPIEETNEVDLLFKVKEKRTGSANFGAGFGGGYGMTGFLDLTQSNLFGRGKSVQIRFEFGTRMTNIDLNYSDQYFMNTPVSFDVGVFNMRRKLQNDPYQDRYKGFFTRFGFPVPKLDYTRFYIGYSLMSIDIRGDSTLVALYTGANVGDYPQTSSKVTFTLARDTRLNFQHPQSGSRHGITAEYSGGPMGGNIGFQKYEFESSWYTPTVRENFVLGLKTKLGTVSPFGGSSSPILDYRETYILGGTGYGRDTDIHLRGYDDRTVGVGGQLYRRGRAYFTITAEEEIKITDQVYGVFFAEAGNVWTEFSDVNLSKLRRSAGVGVRLETPMGPLGLELGYGFDQTNADGTPAKSKWLPHFRFGRF
jgi:outer membrane protein insertion porin family